MSRRVSCLAVAVFVLSAAFLASTTFDAAVAQNAPIAAQAAPTGCPAPPAVLQLTQPNIFSEQQEQWLGDAMADMIESDYTPVKDPAENEKHIAWARKSFDSLGKFAIGRYVNFMGEEGDEGVRVAYGEEKLRRLVALKDKYDPQNIFRFNQNVRPSKLDA